MHRIIYIGMGKTRLAARNINFARSVDRAAIECDEVRGHMCKLISIITVTLIISMLSACGVYSSSEFYSHPSTPPVNPDKYEVNSSNYPIYRSIIEFIPPSVRDCRFNACAHYPMAPIKVTDLWRVTHIYENRYIIESEKYNVRECMLLYKTHHYGFSKNLFSGCTHKLNFGIYINANGVIAGGWQLLPGTPLLFGERYMHLGINVGSDWPDGILFRKSH